MFNRAMCVLGIVRNVPRKEIIFNFRVLYSRFHPDKWTPDSPFSLEEGVHNFKEIENARDLLIEDNWVKIACFICACWKNAIRTFLFYFYFRFSQCNSNLAPHFIGIIPSIIGKTNSPRGEYRMKISYHAMPYPNYDSIHNYLFFLSIYLTC